MPQIGYFYLIKGFVIGEAIDISKKTYYHGHAEYWEAESKILFRKSKEIHEINLCCYGCDRGRITLFENEFKIFGTSQVLINKELILLLFGFDRNHNKVLYQNDEHYMVDFMDKHIIERNLNYFELPIDYPYLIGKL